MVVAPAFRVFKRDFLPFVRAIGCDCEIIEKRHYFEVYTKSFEVKDNIFSLYWQRSYRVDWDDAVHIYEVKVFGEKSEEIEVKDGKKLVGEITPFFGVLMRNIFMHAVTYLAPDKWFVMPNERATLFYRHADFPVTVVPEVKDEPKLVLTGKYGIGYRPQIVVVTDNAQSILNFLTKSENVPKVFISAPLLQRI